MIFNSEHAIQCSLIKWFDLRYPNLAQRLVAVPNAGKMPAHVGAKFNREGRRKGFPDLLLLTPRFAYHGLALELKSLAGRATREQNEWIIWLKQQGYCAQVCKGFDEAVYAISGYLDAPD